MHHVSEVAHILRHALNNDHDRVRAYAELLITKLHEDGEDRQANILHTVLYPSLDEIGKRIVPTATCSCTGQGGGVNTTQCPAHDCTCSAPDYHDQFCPQHGQRYRSDSGVTAACGPYEAPEAFVPNMPSNECECGGYIDWEERDTHWSGSCWGICSGYPLIWRTPQEAGSGQGDDEIGDLIEASSLGTPVAKDFRESVSDEDVDRIMDRVNELDDAAFRRPPKRESYGDGPVKPHAARAKYRRGKHHRK